ncbi:colicin release lysis protein [Klebsiella quasipneumoniae]
MIFYLNKNKFTVLFMPFKKSFPISICVIILLAACQANYIRDVKEELLLHQLLQI